MPLRTKFGSTLMNLNKDIYLLIYCSTSHFRSYTELVPVNVNEDFETTNFFITVVYQSLLLSWLFFAVCFKEVEIMLYICSFKLIFLKW